MSASRRLGLAAPAVLCLLLSASAWAAPKAPGKGAASKAPSKAPAAKPANKAPAGKPANKSAAGKPPSKAERAAARDAYDKGTAAFDKGDYSTALDNFVKANSIIPSIQAMYWIALSQDRLGQTQTAIDGYEALEARDDFSKLSPDKASTVHERLAALKQPPPPPPPPPPPEPVAPPPPPPPAPEPVAPPPPAPPVSEPPPPITPSKLLPKANTVELGVTAGALFVADSNNLMEAGKLHTTFDPPVWQAGVHAAYYPAKFLGVEAEWAHGFGSSDRVQTIPSHSANFDVARGHLIAQLPTSQLVPFLLLGGGVIHASSNPGGTDTDFALHGGLGIKVLATRVFVPRLDVRLNLSQKQGGGLADGIALHPEVLLGLGLRLGS